MSQQTKHQKKHNKLVSETIKLIGGYKAYRSLSKKERKKARERTENLLRLKHQYEELDKEWENQDNVGYTYIIANKAWPGWLKIGHTINASRRLAEYQTCSPFRDYILVYKQAFVNRIKAELDIHCRLKGLGYQHKNEWFKASIASVLVVFETVTHSIGDFNGSN